MPIGLPYSRFTPDASAYDAIVIGSGMGGMGVAAILAKAGKKVLLLEQHYVIGGFSHVFKRNGYEWDVGLHYVGDVHRTGTLPNRAFRYVSNGKLEWTSMGDVYDKAVFGDEIYDFVRGRQQLKARLQTYFPAAPDVEAIERYFQLLDDVHALHPGYFIEKALPPFVPAWIGRLLQKKLLKYADRTTLSVLQELTSNTRLIGVLTAQYGDYGLPPAQSSFYMHALVANHYIEGAAYPVGGSASLAATIVPVIEAHGGKVLFNARVASILVSGNTATGVQMADGTTLRAKAVISDTGIVNTFLKLLPPEVAQKHRLQDVLQPLAPATAHVGLYVGLRQSPEELGLPKNNYWVFPPNYDHDRSQANYGSADAPLPVAYISFPSSKDPTWTTRYPGRSVIEVIGLLPYAWFAPWADKPWRNRGADYVALKERIADTLLEQLYHVEPQLKGKIDYHELSTPLSTRKFVGHETGAMYGLAHTPARFRQRCLRAHTPVRGLYLTGQDVTVASITGALLGGVVAASAVLKSNMLSHIVRETSA